MLQLVGQTLNRYRIVSLLGEGGMGAVFKAHDLALERDVAIKVLFSHFAGHANFQEHFLQEARTAAKLDHSNIVQVHDFGQDGEYLYIVMKFIPGDDLEKMLRNLRSNGKWIQVYEACVLIQQVSNALDYAHRQGVLHRDIKPGNIMIEPELSGILPYHPVITDLGLAKLADGGIITQEPISMGTPAYMSPEQALGVPADFRADIYSLGVLLFELTTGRLPFPARTLAEAIQYHSNTPVPFPASIHPDIPAELEKIILRCMEKQPANRFSNAAELSAALQDLSQSLISNLSAPFPLEAASLFGEYQQSLFETRESYVLKEADAPINSRIDQIQVDSPDKPTFFVLISKPRLMVGRDPDNDIVLEDGKASRHHARIEFFNGNYQITDLNSTNGTFLSEKRLISGVPEVWDYGKNLRIGNTHFQLISTAIVENALFSSHPKQIYQNDSLAENQANNKQPFTLILDPIEMELAPGERADFSVSIKNNNNEADTCLVTLTGIPESWQISRPNSFNLDPGEQTRTAITIEIPMSSDCPAGSSMIGVRATSRNFPAEIVETSLLLNITPNIGFSSELLDHHISHGKIGQIYIQNLGNIEDEYSVEWNDQSDLLIFTPPNPRTCCPWRGKKIYRFSSRNQEASLSKRPTDVSILSRNKTDFWTTTNPSCRIIDPSKISILDHPSARFRLPGDKHNNTPVN